MSFCKFCGIQINDGVRFCPSCGAPVEQEQVPQYSYSQPQPVSPSQMSKKDKTNAMGGWLKFLIYVALFLGALFNIGTAAQTLAGQPYANCGGKELVYLFIPKLKSIDMFFVVLCFALAAIAIIARFRLAAFKKDGPYLLYGLYAVNIIGSIIVTVQRNNAVKDTGLTFNNSGVITSLVIAAVFLVINIIYFSKRKQYFE